MKGDNISINIRYNDGKVKRLSRGKASDIVEDGRAKYISNTLYKAAKAGVPTKPGMKDSAVKALIRAASRKKVPEAELPEKKRKRVEKPSKA